MFSGHPACFLLILLIELIAEKIFFFCKINIENINFSRIFYGPNMFLALTV